MAKQKKVVSTSKLVQSSEVEILGGFKHPQKGFFVEVGSSKLPHQTISVWNLKHETEFEENNFFLKFFGMSVTTARTICAKRGQFIWQK